MNELDDTLDTIADIEHGQRQDRDELEHRMRLMSCALMSVLIDERLTDEMRQHPLWRALTMQFTKNFLPYMPQHLQERWVLLQALRAERGA